MDTTTSPLSIPETKLHFEQQLEQTIGSDPYPWILHPVIDLLFSCGGFLCLLLIVIIVSGVTQEIDFSTSWLGVSLFWLNIIGQYIISSSHQPATLWRVFVSKPTRDSIGPFVIMLGIVLGALGIYLLFHQEFTGILVRITLAWSIQHTLAQAYGVALIYCIKNKFSLSKHERSVFYWMFQTALLYLVVRMFSYTNFLQGDLYGITLPVIGPLPEWICTTALGLFQINTLLFVCVLIRKWLHERTLMPFPAVATTTMALATLSLTYVLPATFVIFIPTFYHASQYLVVTTAFYLKERGLPDNVPPFKISSMLKKEIIFNYIVVIAATGALLYIGTPRILYELGFNKSNCLCIVYCVFNLHHYLTDAAIWKMKDPQVRKLLVA